MAKIYDIVATTGEYQARDGQTKKRYTTIGAVFQTERGMSMKLESVPVGWSGWANFYEPRQNKQQPQAPTADYSAEDVPF